jgi:hypothetical protein
LHFEKGTKIRTRIQCKAVTNGHTYLFHPLTKVMLVRTAP